MVFIYANAALYRKVSVILKIKGYCMASLVFKYIVKVSIAHPCYATISSFYNQLNKITNCKKVL